MSDQRRADRAFPEAYVDNLQIAESLLLAACNDIDSTLSLRVVISLRHHDYKNLLATKCEPRCYVDAISYAKDAQIVALIGKYPSWPVSTDDDRRLAGIAKFLNGEKKNRETNKSFYPRVLVDGNALRVANLAKSIIWDVLTETPPSVADLDVRFGQGATFGLKRRFADPYQKLSTLEVTSKALPYATSILNANLSWFEALTAENPDGVKFDIKQGNSLFDVEKDAEEFRVCGKEPCLNGLMQLMYGTQIRKLLQQNFNILQSNAQEHHGKLARWSSTDEKRATLDAKNASGSITVGVVQFFLPPKWFETLDDLRSPHYTYDEGTTWTEYEQFSSMGNGFTFELETLIFYALARASCILSGQPVGLNWLSVYGDDVIIPAKAVSLYKEAFTAVGFELNIAKSFTEGPFRESCGVDCFDGYDVRPAFLRDEISPAVLYTLHNQLVVYGTSYIFPGLTQRILDILSDRKTCVVKHGIAKTKLNFGPFNGSDGHLVNLSHPRYVPFHSYVNIPTYAPLHEDVWERINIATRKIKSCLKRIRHFKITKGSATNIKSYKNCSFVRKALKWAQSQIDKLNTLNKVEWFEGSRLVVPFALYRLSSVDNDVNHDRHWTARFLTSNGTSKRELIDNHLIAETLPYKGRVYLNRDNYQLKSMENHF